MNEAIKHIAGILADERTIFRYTDDGVEMVTRHKFDQSAFEHMLHHGWLVSTPGCGGYTLSEAGLMAYFRSTDEMGDGKVIDPTGYKP